ncbi:MAG: 2-iminobutanoate/2-iminopropanoate deaminase [Actinomycetota bacterium]|jgi:2-iminobutanoate/2-iminopropanoate deaminase|nr:2-iminobutanoate/2-iminopropanoate deaminase [Actinomycetota bacterium]
MRQAVSADSAPAALGPYSQAIIANGFVFCSGTAGIDPATGAVAEGIEAQAEQALRNLDAILAAAGASLATLVKTTIFYQNVGDFAAINAVYARYMPEPPPARSAPANVNLPRGLLISIDAIAVLPAA